jgi:GT2 family glycosyltransferase
MSVKMANGRLRYAIDAVGVGSCLSLNGWAIHTTQSIRSLSLSVGGQQVLARHGLPRPDVAAAFPQIAHAVTAGFIATAVPMTAVGDALALIVELEDGRRHVEPLGTLVAEPEGLRPRLTTPHTTGTVVPLTQRPNHNFTSMDALLRADLGRVPDLLVAEPALLIVPVYGGLVHLRPFFESLYRNTTGPHRVVVVDDGNPDPQVVALIDKMTSGRDGVQLVRQPTNRGYVEAIHAGFALWRGEHVVVVNTDVVLPPGWLERLLYPMQQDRRIASTTPFSTCASICGFPLMPDDNPLYLGLDVDEIDAVFRQIDPDIPPLTIPSGVGFCMAMSRHAIECIGFIERETFGAGYGEENDWSQKAVRQGMRNVQIPNLFIYHKHGGSFPSKQKQRLVERNLKIIAARYPNYHGEVAELILADPFRELRGFIAFRLAAQQGDGALLLICGGTQGADALAARLDEAQAAGQPTIVMQLFPGLHGWTYRFLWGTDSFCVTGANFAELPLLVKQAAVREIVTSGLTGTLAPQTLAETLAGIPPFIRDCQFDDGKR